MPKKPANLTPEIWHQIKARQTKRRKEQPNLISHEELVKIEIERKLIEAVANVDPAIDGETWFNNFFRCGRDEGFVMCAACGHGRPAPYQCSQKWCPVCNWRISFRRKILLEEITRGMPQLKHVVLTQKNFPNLTPEKIDESRKALFMLRRRKVFERKPSGCASLEFTNEDCGWHMHWHLLLTQKWVDAKELSIIWGKLVGQEFAIVKVKSVNEVEFLREVCKYVVKPEELAKWTPAQIVQFIKTISTKRCFSTFGKFRDIAKLARQKIKGEKKPCTCPDCGASEFVHGESERDCSRIISKIYG